MRLNQQRLATLQAAHERVQEKDLLHQMLKETKKALKLLDAQHRKLEAQARILKLRALIDRRQKVGNKMITGQYKATNSMALKVVEVDGQTHTTPEAVMEATVRYYTRKMVPATGVKNGKYYPEDQPRAYPWQMTTAVDHFTLETQATSPAGNRDWLHKQMADGQAFQACLKTLAKGKAPGPDNITNDMLQLLPEEGQGMLHALVQLMWATAHTPQTWKHSVTVLLYKNKGTPLQLDYYRRIGLENTMYKLWTRFVTWALTHHAETNCILTQTQAGFRNKRTTMDQLELMQLVLEDAMHTSQDVFLTMLDATEAFDTVDHDKLLQIMFDLGFPLDAIEVVKQLYTGATTAFKTPYGLTAPIAVQRGTIQGDSLSPFLYIVYTEPLLRWLRVGAARYKPGALRHMPEQQSLHSVIPDVTYADDLNLLTNTAAEMKQQVDKAQAFAAWAHLLFNIKKTLVTAALYRTRPKDPYDRGTIQRLLAPIKIRDQTPTFNPPEKPFKLLGVHMTMNLSTGPQFTETVRTLREMTTNLTRSPAAPYQKMRTLMSCIRPKIRYTFCLAPYTMAQLGVMDSILAQAAKQAAGLKKYIANTWAHEDRSRGGLGCHSLQVEYHEVQIQRLVHGLNDKGILGQLTRASMARSKTMVDQLTATVYPAVLRYNFRLRQQLACANLDVVLAKDKRVTHAMPNKNSLFTEMEKLQPVVQHTPPELLVRLGTCMHSVKRGSGIRQTC